MDKLLALRTFVEVAETGGFSKAARRLGVATSSVTRLMDALEDSLGAVLLTRTTRQVLLTDAGTRYLEQVARLLSELEEADGSVADSKEEPLGNLRVSVPVTYSRRCLGRHLSGFLHAYPRVTLDLVVTDAYLDLAAERLDLAVRIGIPDRDEQLVVRKLAENQRFLVAADSYLEQAGLPRTPPELATHPCLRFAYRPGRQRWSFVSSGQAVTVEVGGPFLTNSLDMLHTAALDGHGIALLPEWLVRDDLQAGRLTRLFEQWGITPQSGEAYVYAAYLPNRRHSRKVHAFLEYLDRHLPG